MWAAPWVGVLVSVLNGVAMRETDAPALTRVLTFGVEEEFLLVGGVTGETVSRAGALLAQAGEHPWATGGGGYHAELFDTQLESATGTCTELADLRHQLRLARGHLAGVAEGAGLRLLSTGTPVLRGRLPAVASDERFARILGMHAGLVADYQSCGCHVHVGVADRDTAVAVVNHLRPWLPTLLALSANSPFDRGKDSGYASWRMIEQARFPGAGVPPWFASAADHQRLVERLVDCGVLADTAMTFWLARPSARLPTVEIRAADAAATVDEAVLQAALTRALVSTALADLALGREAPRVDGSILAAAVWNAARHGLEGPGVDPFEERPIPAAHLLRLLLARVRPALEESGDLPEVTALLAGAERHGTGAVRQRRAAAGGLRAVVDLLATQTLCGTLTPEERQTP
ncbi:glutamate--cysteine ligase [Nonomuraea sp. NPDC049152]|uniref:carboxylate-amine ligase n=1 Tax=Nonomuraea sp. NPDC049152 TaxID=3154350 RepID=UPI0033EE8AA5